MQRITELDILKLVKKQINFPYSQKCIHAVALDLLSMLEEHGYKARIELVKAVGNADDNTALALLNEAIKPNKQQRSRNVLVCGRQERSLVQSGEINQVLRDYGDKPTEITRSRAIEIILADYLNEG